MNSDNQTAVARRGTSLRLRLLLLVFFAILPAVGLIVWTVYEEREDHMLEAERQGARVAERVAAEYGQIVDFTHETLLRLTREPIIHPLSDPQACGRRLADVRALNPAFGLIGVINRDGHTVCAAEPRAVGVDLSDRGYFREAMEGRRFVTSGFLVGRTTGMNIMVLAEPVLEADGSASAVIFMSLDMDWIGHQMEKMVLPPDSNIALLDGSGTLMAIDPSEPERVGNKIPELETFLAHRDSGRVPPVRMVGVDEVSRVYVSRTLPRAPPGSAFARAGIPTAGIIAEADEALRRNLLTLGGAAMLAFAAAWWFADLLVVRPTRRLIAAAEALGSGDMAARSELKHGGDELGRLALHFDSMAARLQRLTRALRTLSASNRGLLHAQEENALLRETCRVAVQEGGYRVAWVGYLDPADRSVTTMAVAGPSAELNRWIETHAGRDAEGPAALAMRSGRPQVMQQAAPAVATPLAVCALPLTVHGEVMGALKLYAEDRAAFDAAELELLEEMAADLAFGIQTLRDRLEHARAEEKIRRMAYVDSLTGLPNRTRLEETYHTALAAARQRGAALALIVISLERFTRVQLAIGFNEGDALLVAVTNRLRQAVDPAWCVARLVSDRFAVLVPDADPVAAIAAARRLAAEFDAPFAVAGIAVDLNANLGIALYPEHGDDPGLLIRRADIASMHARTSGLGIQLYHQGIEQESPERLQLMVDLRRAIDAGELTVHYQGKVGVRDGVITGAEALVRWHHPLRGDTPPGIFIPDAEQTGLIKPLTYWMLETVVRKLDDWQPHGVAVPVAVNLSARNFRDPDLLDWLRRLLEHWQVPPRLLQIEITESVLMEDVHVAQRVLGEMRALGLRIFIDDFGTGYSSLRYLASLPVDAVKIDRSFIVEMEQRPDMHALVTAIVDMSHKLGLKVIAEGVDNEAQQSMLHAMDCDEIQGFLHCRPQPAASFLKWAAQRAQADSTASR
ncbi:hypothetical protein Tel_01135 [Candidatus Tenderia electrophaga]|jgi:diguanylate cyclase (GGDEF)-like protein|uniref:Diguanylate cyclase n=1 Tax=Candidatus Tenderia electrophaga TaxID=1748243 RepID=A0A0S2T9R5_9GAMM|nr:hypothetical protein Tel_01135 [Candidatus Tenderia electrophaga]